MSGPQEGSEPVGAYLLTVVWVGSGLTAGYGVVARPRSNFELFASVDALIFQED